MKYLPIACSLTPEALAGRRTGFRDLAARIAEARVTDRRFLARFTPAASLLPDIARFVNLERDCCRFLRFKITVEEDGGPVWLGISGPPGTGRFIESMIPSQNPG